MTVSLHERGVFTWPEWSAALAREIRSSALRDDRQGESYYQHWLKALETLISAKGVASSEELGHVQQAWHRAAERTPHGQPIVLSDEDFERTGGA
jgi:nitrile hydratase accessory protein